MNDRLDQLLDELEPPPLSAGFGDAVMARIAAADAPALPPLPRRGGRSGWSWGRRTLAGAAAFGLVSAAAATTGILGHQVRDLPVIGRVIASIAPAAKPKPKPSYATEAAAVVSGAPAPEAETPQFALPPPPIAMHERRDAIAARFPIMRERIERRVEARREALALPPRDSERPRFPLVRERIDQRIEARRDAPQPVTLPSGEPAERIDRAVLSGDRANVLQERREAIAEALQADPAATLPDRPRVAEIIRSSERAERLRQLRELRERRRVLREQRRQ
jgi:hypothetical protein